MAGGDKLAKTTVKKPYKIGEFGVAGAHEVIWLVNFALPLQVKCSFTLSKLRFDLLHEAQNFLNQITYLIQNSKFKIQNR